MPHCLFSLPRKWVLILNLVFFFFILLFTFQVKIPTREFLYAVGWNNAQSNSTIKSIPCLPVKNIVFLKTHKTASSSIQNILLRYAYKKGLIVALPPERDSNRFSMMKPFQKEMVIGVPWENFGFNILCHHMIFNGPVIKSLMPKDTLFISIVRDPVTQFESLYEYSLLEDFFKMDIEEYARSTKNISLMKKLQKRSQGVGRNQMLYDFGVHPTCYKNPSRIKSAIENIDKYFDFVMIAEHFDESIVILRHILCWELDDVISLTINARVHTYKKNLSEEAKMYLRQWNLGDEMLYNHFLKKFEETINDIGKEQLQYEVQELRVRRKEWLDYCIEEQVEAKNLTAYKIWSKKVSGYKIKSGIHNQTCENLGKPEIYITAEIRQKQLLKSLLKGVKIPNYGPKSLNYLLDIKYLKGHEQEIARKFVQNQYKYNRKKIIHLKKE